MDFNAEELRSRRQRFAAAMNARCPDWDTAALTDPVNQYYFTGTIQDGIVLIRRDAGNPRGSALFYGVRRSFYRAEQESPLFKDPADRAETLAPMRSYRDIAEKTGADLGKLYLEGDTFPLAALERLGKYFSFSGSGSGPAGFLDPVIQDLRGVKSQAELSLIRRSGEAHRAVLEEAVPGLLREGMSEAEFMGELAAAMYRHGYQGLNRFHQSHGGITIGQIGFGANSLYPSMFDGPGGAKGDSPAAPLSADHSRRLSRGDAVFVDIGFGVRGYHSDKTQVYFFGAGPPQIFEKAHRFCLAVQTRLAERLVPGAVPAKIYQDITASLSEEDLDCFMGVDNRHRVKFLGHGVGLTIDEAPVIAAGFDKPLEENMVIALEPKKGVPGIGMAGVEDTYIVTPRGGVCVTGGGKEIIQVKA
ncbi:MAG: Xaa-Pro peptidase family protein [Spirochaetaceae bacterium]|jgi:Xaa-Pro aminopeptidase|nr:Xaa-Pro peptidase family protein [Spirochaetaceae bacterium]